MSAADAIAAGSTYLVVGRPVIAAVDPRVAARSIASEIASALARR
jgi:orotidine-5'-phosphate decarboxylase